MKNTNWYNLRLLPVSSSCFHIRSKHDTPASCPSCCPCNSQEIAACRRRRRRSVCSLAWSVPLMLLPLLCSSISCLLVILGSAACWSCCCRAPPFHCRCSLGCEGLSCLLVILVSVVRWNCSSQCRIPEFVKVQRCGLFLFSTTILFAIVIAVHGQ